MMFVSPDRLQSAKVRVRSQMKQFEECPRNKAWLDAKKERSELRPARMCHRLHDVLGHVEEKRGGDHQPAELDKNMMQKTISANKTRVALIIKGSVMWTEAGKRWYSAEGMALATSYAEDD